MIPVFLDSARKHKNLACKYKNWLPDAVEGRYLLCQCGHLLFKEDISFASVAISSSKKISPLPVLTFPVKRRYLLCQG
jgi:hypothetical protein